MNLFRRNRPVDSRAEGYGWQPIPPELAPPAPPSESSNGREAAVPESRPDSQEDATGVAPPPARRRAPRPRARTGKTEKELLLLLDPNADIAAAPDDEVVETKPPARRRGGRGRGTAAEAPAAAAPDLTGLSGDTRVIAELLMRQTAALEAFAERQVMGLAAVQRSMDVMASRIGSGGLPGAPSRLPRCGVFVDVPNIIYTADRMRARIDFGKLLDLLVEGRELVRASAYAPISDDPSQALESQRFVQPFVDRGYKIVTKPLKRFADGSIKANFDVELAIDILTMADRLDVVCLVSGDGDFRRLVEIVESKGVRVEVIAFGQSTAGELKTMADDYIELGSILDRIV